MIRIHHILKDLKISLETLNEEMEFLNLIKFDLNSKIDTDDASFIMSYFQSNEFKELCILEKKIVEQRKLLKNFFIKLNRNVSEMGNLEKKLLFDFINEKENSIAKPKLLDYNETNFWILYNWFEKWNNLSKIEKIEEENKILDEIIKNDLKEITSNKKKIINVVDGESEIMNALSNGYGDLYGF